MHGNCGTQFMHGVIEMEMTSSLTKFNEPMVFKNYYNFTRLETGNFTHALIGGVELKDTSTGAVNDVVSGSGMGLPSS